MVSRWNVVLLLAVTSLSAALVPRSVHAGFPSAGVSARHTQLFHSRSEAPAVASVYWIQKGVAVQPPHKKAGKGKKGQKLFNQYGVRTARGQKADLNFPDTTHLRMNQLTAIVLRNPHLTQVTKGTIEEEIQPGTSHQIQTASAVATAIGTRFIEKVTRKTVGDTRKKKGTKTKRVVVTTEVIVEEGVVDVRNQQGDVVVHAGQETTVQQGKAPAPPVSIDVRSVTGWTQNIPRPAVEPGKNVALQDNGGRVIAASNQDTSAAPAARAVPAAAASWPANAVNDGQLTTGWSTGHGNRSNQSVILGFGPSGTYVYDLSSVVIDPAATGGHSAANDLKDFEIWASPAGIDPGSFSKVYAGTAKQSATLQLFKFDQPVRTRYLKLVALNNYGGDAIDVAELEAVSNSGPVVAPTPTPTTPPTATTTPVATPTSPAGLKSVSFCQSGGSIFTA